MERVPAEVFRPGDFIRDEIEGRGWSQSDLASIIGRTDAVISELINGKRGVTPDTAQALADAFGTTAEFWLRVEAAYQAALLRDRGKSDAVVSLRAKLYSKAPVREMVRRGWLEDSSNPDVLSTQLLNFLQIPDLDAEPVFWAAARKSTDYGAIHPSQTAWLFRTRHLASAVSVMRPFSPRLVPQALATLQSLLADPPEIRQVPVVLANIGVRFLIVEDLASMKMDGACFWLDDKSPVIALSLRYDRIDYFWHTLMHEFAHVAAGDGKTNAPLDADLMDDDGKPPFEVKANQQAAAWLVPQDRLQDFIVRIKPLYSKARIANFAKLIGVHPGIVVGQLQKREEIPYSHSRDLLVKVNHIITAAALTDGWGQPLPAAV